MGCAVGLIREPGAIVEPKGEGSDEDDAGEDG